MSFFAPSVWASTCHEQFDREKVQAITGLSDEQLRVILAGSGSISSIAEIQAQGGIPANSILLGPWGRLYKSLVGRYNMINFWGAHAYLKLDPHEVQSDERLNEFFLKLSKQKRFQVYFLIPERIEKTLITRSEILILLKHPELMAHIHFIYSDKSNFKTVELDSAQSPGQSSSRTSKLVLKLMYYFRFLIN